MVRFLLWMSVVHRYTPVLNGISKFRIQKRATDQSWLPPGPVVRMWSEKADGTPKLPKGVPAPIPLRPLWGKVVVNHTKKNQQKELIRAGKCLTK